MKSTSSKTYVKRNLFMHKKLIFCSSVALTGMLYLSSALAISTPNDTVPGFVEKNTDDRGYSLWAGRDYPTHVYFGDTHHHTANSGDAFMNGDRLSPEDAYRFARGEEVISSTGQAVRL
ncbi:MAG: DUF3604 domain-containing protein, partial [Desulfocapsa sp.]|nr:DUF3604 domain-containing protein [Desulfocapsa sp.]